MESPPEDLFHPFTRRDNDNGRESNSPEIDVETFDDPTPREGRSRASSPGSVSIFFSARPAEQTGTMSGPISPGSVSILSTPKPAKQTGGSRKGAAKKSESVLSSLSPAKQTVVRGRGPSTNSSGKPPRSEQSLNILAVKVVEILRKERVANLTEISQRLHINKRRLYDVTNVLEGLGMVHKEGRSTIRWVQKRALQPSASDVMEKIDEYNQRLIMLSQTEKKLEYALRIEKSKLQNRRFGYVHKSHIARVLPGMTAIGVRTPLDTKFDIECSAVHDDPKFMYECKLTTVTNQPLEMVLTLGDIVDDMDQWNGNMTEKSTVLQQMPRSLNPTIPSSSHDSSTNELMDRPWLELFQSETAKDTVPSMTCDTTSNDVKEEENEYMSLSSVFPPDSPFDGDFVAPLYSPLSSVFPLSPLSAISPTPFPSSLNNANQFFYGVPPFITEPCVNEHADDTVDVDTRVFDRFDASNSLQFGDL